MRIFICGFGTVGQGFAEVVADKTSYFKKRYGRDAIIVGAMDSKSYVVDQNGLDPIGLVATKKDSKRVGANTRL